MIELEREGKRGRACTDNGDKTGVRQKFTELLTWNELASKRSTTSAPSKIFYIEIYNSDNKNDVCKVADVI